MFLTTSVDCDSYVQYLLLRYATKYATLAVELLAVLPDASAQKLSATLAASPGFSSTGLFRLQTTGPRGTFNWGDSDGELVRKNSFWLDAHSLA